mgnify:CR=1 FL=1
MTNRLSKWTRHSQKMVCLLAACGFLYGCKDEYLLDDEKPSTLSTSILESLQNPKAQGMGTFNTYLRLIADKDVNTGDRSLTDVLSRTGSKTVFVANDDAWSAFFKKNATLPESTTWGVHAPLYRHRVYRHYHLRGTRGHPRQLQPC